MLLKPSSPIVPAKIIVCGIGGAGNNAINSMIESGLIKGVHFIAINTDSQALERISTDAETMVIGSELTKGLGAGGNPAVGKQAAQDSVDYINEALVGSDMVFITAGMGGGTGTGAAPEIAGIAKQLGALTIGVVTKPFAFEMQHRMQVAEKGIAELESKVDALIVIPNERLLQISERDTTFFEAMRKSDEVLLNAVKSISDIITITGHINVDFADVKAIMQDAGSALMGVGESSSKEDRAKEAALKAINSPLLDYSIHGAKGVLISIRASTNMGIAEVSEAVEIIKENVDPKANLKYGVIVDDTLGDTFTVTVLATGFSINEKPRGGGFFSQNNDEINQYRLNTSFQRDTSFKQKEQELPKQTQIDENPTSHNLNQDNAHGEELQINSSSQSPFSTRGNFPSGSNSLNPSKNSYKSNTSYNSSSTPHPSPNNHLSNKSDNSDDLDIPAFLRRRKELDN